MFLGTKTIIIEKKIFKNKPFFHHRNPLIKVENPTGDHLLLSFQKELIYKSAWTPFSDSVPPIRAVTHI